jgi:hypothetical protein
VQRLVSASKARSVAQTDAVLWPRYDGELAAATAQVLTQGGDPRISLDAAGLNRYGCAALPDPLLLAFGSSTASVISAAGFAAACALHARLRERPESYHAELALLREEVLRLSGAAAIPGCELVLAASGTDIHLFASQLAASQDGAPLCALMAEAAETGSGVPAALGALHFSASTCQGQPVQSGTPLASGALAQPAFVRLREADGALRSCASVDADFEAQAEQIVQAGQCCLLVLTDLSKTGLLAPSPACALRLARHMGERLVVLVDACQARLAPSTLADYLACGFMVALTGSKFITGPAFCGALLLPPALALRCRGRSLRALQCYSARSDWPAGWPAAAVLGDAPQWGLLLRWAAALAELRRLRAVPAASIDRFFVEWGQAVTARIALDPGLEALPVRPLVRGAAHAAAGWDSRQTIFPFLLLRTGADGQRRALSADETALVYRQMRESAPADYAACISDAFVHARFELGQPVPCGSRNGRPLHALRLCASARLAADAAALAHGSDEAIEQAMRAFDKLTWLVARLPIEQAH